MVKVKEPSKTSLGTTQHGSEANLSIKKSTSLDRTSMALKQASFDQINVSNRFMSICENLGIPVNKSRANHGGYGAEQ